MTDTPPTEPARRPPGRPPLFEVTSISRTVRLPQFAIDWLRDYGDGSISRGILRLMASAKL